MGWRLNDAGLSLQGNRKTNEGADLPDRNAQFERISEMAQQFQSQVQPVISVDTKEELLVGEYKNGGREWQSKGKSLSVKTHDFLDADLGKAIPYGVYDFSRKEGWVSVGIDHDTGRLAAQAIHRWWKKMGAKRYPSANQLLITADGGDSNGSRSRFVESCAARFGAASEPTGPCLSLSAWHQKIEQNRVRHVLPYHPGEERPAVGQPRSDCRTDRQHPHARRTEDTRRAWHFTLSAGTKVSDEQLASINLKRDKFLGDWNYTLSSPRRKT